MIGLTRDNRRLLCLACDGKPGSSGYVLEDAARVLQQAGAYNALLIDEGADAFQYLRAADGNLMAPIPLKRGRGRIRATFIVACAKEHRGDGPEEDALAPA
jgi:exopolysaccharide biosynthesis protein